MTGNTVLEGGTPPPQFPQESGFQSKLYALLLTHSALQVP